MNRATVVIFLVEDEPLIQEVLQLALEDSGFEVNTAGNSRKAIAMLEAQAAEFQALITDVDLAPGTLTGWDVAKRARELNPDLPVVYMTGSCAHDWNSMGVTNSILLMKPFTFAQAVTAISQLLNASRPGHT